MTKRKMKYMSPYIKFSINQRPDIEKKHPNFDARDIFSEMGRRWNNLSDNEKSKYERRRKK